MEDVAKIYFRDQLRTARALALQDAEGYQEILFSIERLGTVLSTKISTLGGKYKDHINDYANRSPLAIEIPSSHPTWHVPFPDLYNMITKARNDALHHGAFARHLTTHAIQLALVLEDTLMSDLDKVGNYMVREPVCASEWQPISFIRQQMLANSFSYLPVLLRSSEWYLISDASIALYLPSDTNKRKECLARTLKETLDSNELQLDKAQSFPPETPIKDVLQVFNGRPILIHHSERTLEIVGILTAFDLL